MENIIVNTIGFGTMVMIVVGSLMIGTVIGTYISYKFERI